MCAKSGHKINKVITFVMNLILKICKNAFKKLFRLTLYELFWGSVFLGVCFIFWICGRYSTVCELKKSDNPVIVWWTAGFPGTAETKKCPGNLKCDIYSQKNISHTNYVEAFLFYGSNIEFEDLPLPRRPTEIIWGLYHEESPRNREELSHERILKLFNYSSTLSRYSDIPFPLQYLESFEDITSRTYFVETPAKNSFLSEIAPVMYIQSDCETSTERDTYMKELMKYINVDSYGGCLNNKQLESKFTHDYLNHLNDDSFLQFIARYKFVMAIENGVCDDYITEKFWRAIKVGSVPIYFGSPSIRDWFPNKKSAIMLEDFPTPKILSEHLKKLMKNDTLYEKYLAHKIEQTITNERLINEYRMRPNQLDAMKTVEDFECLICKKLHQKRKGMLVERTIDKTHYNCPKPISALTLSVNPENDWVSSWDLAGKRAEKLCEKIMNME
ncbi:GDP-fucose protein O-fucosyltransferase 3-like [Choristoneura fumiferana]|uniref:GDP-fucose protein O-fucosyltransferase 3-like n=1 Tax=Choristoneura fumiferana TaxID=7141 RepID=UPI003D15BDD7